MMQYSTMNEIERLYEQMSKLGIKPTQMANMLDVSTSLFANWKTRGSIPKKYLERISESLFVSIPWLISGKIDAKQKEYGERLRQYMVEQGVFPATISKHTGINAHKIVSAQDGIIELSDKEYALIAKELGKPASYIKYGADRLSSEKTVALLDKLHRRKIIPEGLIACLENKTKKLIPIFENIEASAGDGTIIEEEIATDHILIETEWLQTIVHHVPKDMAIIKVKGDSMLPTLSPGDMILVDRKPVERNQLNDGVYIINRNGSTHVKRLQNIEDGIRIISDNQAYQAETVTDRLIVCGRVIWAWQGKRF